MPRVNQRLELASPRHVFGEIRSRADRFDHLNVQRMPIGTARERAENLLDTLKWARNVQLGGDRPACLFADPEVLAEVKPILYALATECLIGLPAGRIPTLVLQATPLLEQAGKSDSPGARL